MRERSRHLGVYYNYDNSKPYRVAIMRRVNGKKTYRNEGYFDHENTAAWVYNIHALCAFGKGAIVNDVDFTNDVEEEMTEYLDHRPAFMDMFEQATEIAEQYKDEIRINTR
jgi:hypothetical protein